MDGRYSQSTWKRERICDFAIYLRFADDYDTIFDWAIENGYETRCILRALFLEAKGNVLFGEWGAPMKITPETLEAHRQMYSKMCLSHYIYGEVARRKYPGLSRGAPFLLFLDHYLQPIDMTQMLSEDTLNKIQQGLDDTLFTKQQQRTARSNAYFQLFYVQDYTWIDYHHWKYCRYFQASLVKNYTHLRRWQVSSTWFELFTDILCFILFWFLFLVIRLYPVTDASFDSILWTGTRYFLWIALFETVFYKVEYLYDRFPLQKLVIKFARYAVKFAWLDFYTCSVTQRLTSAYPVIQVAVIWFSLVFTHASVCYYWTDWTTPIRDSVKYQLVILVGFYFLWGLECYAKCGCEVSVYGYIFVQMLYILRDETFMYQIDWNLIRVIIEVPMFASWGLGGIVLLTHGLHYVLRI
jgi:hypothetical protein